MKHILIVNDSKFELMFLHKLLEKNGFSQITQVDSALEALDLIGVSSMNPPKVIPDLILMNLVMPQMDGIEACKRIKAKPAYHNLPIIIMTSLNQDEEIRQAFQAGATDFVSTPIREIPLVARIETALLLKQEMDQRKAREKELMQVMRELDEVNKKLQELSIVDGLTGVFNRRYFDETLLRDWNSCKRQQQPLSLLLLDIDYFKRYNDNYGHLIGDDCLKQVAQAIKHSIYRGSDTVSRYGGEEFGIVLPLTDQVGARVVAQLVLENVAHLQIPHIGSEVSPFVSISIGCSTLIPHQAGNTEELIKQADSALYQAKERGRNQVQSYSATEETK